MTALIVLGVAAALALSIGTGIRVGRRLREENEWIDGQLLADHEKPVDLFRPVNGHPIRTHLEDL